MNLLYVKQQKYIDHSNHSYVWPIKQYSDIHYRYHYCRLEAQPTELVSLTFHSALRKLNTEPSIGASHQVSVHLAKQLEKIFRNQPTRNKNCLWQPCLLTDRDEISNLYRGPSINVSYQVSVELAKQGKKTFRNRPIWNKNCLWQPCLLTNRNEMSNLYRGPSIDAFYQVSVHLVKWIQRRRFLEIHQSETRIACGCHVC